MKKRFHSTGACSDILEPKTFQGDRARHYFECGSFSCELGVDSASSTRSMVVLQKIKSRIYETEIDTVEAVQFKTTEKPSDRIVAIQTGIIFSHGEDDKYHLTGQNVDLIQTN